MARYGLVAASVLALGLSATGLMAQLRDQPAEFPPAGFTGNQYVDSRGCAFIRAGIGGTVSWVPRVSRNRGPLCNFQPTFGPDVAAGPPPGPGRVAPLNAPIIDVGPSLVTATPPPPTAHVVAPAPVRAPAPAARVGAPFRTVASIPAVRQAPAPQPVATPRVVAPAPAPAPRRITLAEACEGRSGIQPGFISSRTGEPINCGPAPQVASATPAVIAAPEPLRLTLAAACAAMADGSVRYVRTDGSPILCETPETIVTQIPPRIAAPVVAPAPVVAASAGAASACPGIPNMGTFNGLPVRCGPQSLPPYTAVAAPAPIATVSTRSVIGQPAVPASNPVVASRAAPQPARGYAPVWTDGRINPQRGQFAQAAPAPQATRVSTRTVPAARVAAPTGHRYVQVGSFGDPANAARLIQRLGGMGLPVASAKSGNLKIVAAGPFADAGDLARALQAVRGMGFADAYTRN